jgi:hypothetical protein
MHTMTPQTGRAFLLLLCAAAALAAGCGGAAVSGGSKTSEGTTAVAAEPLPGDVPSALTQLDQAESQLAQALGDPTFAEAPKPMEAQSGATTTAPAPVSPPRAAPAGEAAADSSAQPSAPPDPCVTACRALASMGRSAAHVCDLAGEGDERCESARGRVSRATDRVRSRCPSCS